MTLVEELLADESPAGLAAQALSAAGAKDLGAVREALDALAREVQGRFALEEGLMRSRRYAPVAAHEAAHAAFLADLARVRWAARDARDVLPPEALRFLAFRAPAWLAHHARTADAPLAAFLTAPAPAAAPAAQRAPRLAGVAAAR